MSGSVLAQTAIGDYRQRPLEELLKRVPDLRVVTGLEYFDATTRTRVQIDGSLEARNRFFLGRRLLWQSGVVRLAVRARVVMLELNPRIISSWVVLLTRKSLRRKSVLWGHAWPRGGSTAPTDSLRQIMRSLADEIVVYTETQAEELRRRMPNARIIAAPNGMYRADEMRANVSTDLELTDFVVVGRLVESKKPGVALDAFRTFVQHNPSSPCRLVFVGAGPLLSALQDRAIGIRERVVFRGHVSDLESVGRLFDVAIATVSPGYVGLSLIQSISFGVPMAIARNEPHSPEIEAAVEGFNALFFPSDDPLALTQQLQRIWDDREGWRAKRAEIADYARSRYSAELMADRLASAFRE